MATTKPPQPVGVAKAVVEGTYGPTTWANVMYFAVGTWDPAHLDDATTLVQLAVHDFYNTVFAPGNFSSHWTTRTVKVAFRDAADSLYRVTIADAVAGTSGAGDQDAQVAYLVNWVTNDPRKGGKPRQYIPGIPDDHVADVAHVSSGVVSGVSANIATWLAGLNARSHGTATGLSMVEVSFRDGGTWRDAAHSWPIRGGTLNTVVATQRRRVDRLRQ